MSISPLHHHPCSVKRTKEALGTDDGAGGFHLAERKGGCTSSALVQVSGSQFPRPLRLAHYRRDRRFCQDVTSPESSVGIIDDIVIYRVETHGRPRDDGEPSGEREKHNTTSVHGEFAPPTLFRPFPVSCRLAFFFAQSWE